MQNKTIYSLLIVILLMALVGCSKDDEKTTPIEEVFDINNVIVPSIGYLYIDHKIYTLYPTTEESPIKETKKQIGEIKRVVEKIEYPGDAVLKQNERNINVSVGDPIYSVKEFPGKEVLYIKTQDGIIMTVLIMIIKN
ncbi:hypothetical protein [Paenibacillus marinisediminis]